MQGYYLDTAIWIDYYQMRGSRGKAALKFMKSAIRKDDMIAYSDQVIKELRQLGYSPEIINNMFSIAKPDHLIRIHAYPEEIEEAIRISRKRGLPKGDVIHAILARDNYLQFVTRDQHFAQLKDISDAKRPENLF
ncbi:MAG: type II toxin-antitoxin system VapC family toxin [Nanoarchaeota archaeon]